MDDYSNRRIAARFVLSRKEPNLISRGSAESNGYQNDQVCSWVGCTSQVNVVKNVQIGSPGRAKTSNGPFRPIGHSQDTSAGSSASSVLKTSRSFFNLKMKLPIEIDSETSSVNDESEEESRYASRLLKAKMSVNCEEENHEDADATSATTGKLRVGPAKRFVKTTLRFGSGHGDSSASSSNSFTSKKNNQGGRNGGSTSAGNRYNLRSFGCNSISDVVPSGSASSSHIDRKRIGESKSGNRGISIPGSSQRRNLSPRDDETVSLRMLQLSERTQDSNQETPNRLSLDANALSPETRFHNRACSLSRTSGIRDHAQPSRSVDLFDVDIGHSYMNQDALRHYNLDALAEMLLALERTEQAQQTIYEQLLVNANLFLGGLSLHDQHRDMRMDIDNMSYEELLALEERMGTVSTALPEEALAKCLKTSPYQGTSDCMKNNDDDIKCSICQEEYGNEDEIGRLGCEHRYHVECIHQWLGLKNWCPICKAAVEPLSPPS